MSLYDAPSGDFTPYVKYNAKAGRWYIKKDDVETEVVDPVFVADLANARKAWMWFMEGQAPNIEFFPSLDAQIERPSENHKQGISVNLFSEKSFGGVVKLESNSINTCSAIGELYQKYMDAPESKEGKLPVVKVMGAEPVKGNYGTNYKPKFSIEKWVDRPVEFDSSPSNEDTSPHTSPAAQADSVSEF